jgi:hypothetical protein
VEAGHSCPPAKALAALSLTSHSALFRLQLLQQSRAVISPNSVSEAAAEALSHVAPHVSERARAAVSLEPHLSQLGDAGLLAAAVMCICRCAAVAVCNLKAQSPSKILWRSTLHGAPAAPSCAVDLRRRLFKFTIRTQPAAAACHFSCAVVGGSLLIQSVLGPRCGSGSLPIASYVAADGSIRKPGTLVHNVALQLLRPLFVLQCGGPGVSLADLPHEVLILVCDQLPPRHAALLARCSRSLCSASSSSLVQRRQQLLQQQQQHGQPARVRSRWGGSGHWIAPPMLDDYPSPYLAWLRNQISRNMRLY